MCTFAEQVLPDGYLLCNVPAAFAFSLSQFDGIQQPQ